MGTKPEINPAEGIPYVVIVVAVEITDAAPKRVLKALGGKPWIHVTPVAVPCPEGEGWDWCPTRAQIEQVGNSIVAKFLVEARVFPDFTETQEGPGEWYDLDDVGEQVVADATDFDKFTFEYSIKLENEEGDEIGDDSPDYAFWATLVPVTEDHTACIFISGRVTRLTQMLVIGTDPPNDSR